MLGRLAEKLNQVGSKNWLIHRINRRIASSLPYRGRVVDLGCGTAPYKSLILLKADEYIGVDWENSYHDQSNVDIFANLYERLPFEDNFADTVTCFQVLEHVPEPRLVLSECYRIIRPGGQLFITVPFMWEVHEAPHDYFRYTRYGLEYLLNKSGFIDIRVEENTGYWQTSALKLNCHTAALVKGPLRMFLMPVWWITQAISPFLDRYNSHPGETASYTAYARKA